MSTPGHSGRRESSCPLDCPDACSLSVEVEDGRIVRITGDHRNPLTAGLICGKVRRMSEHVYGAERLVTPLRRRGAKGAARFEAIGWDEALELVADRLSAVRERWGGEAILPVCYGGSNGLLSQDAADCRLFARLGASRIDRTVCAAPSGAAHRGLYGKMPGVALTDYVHAALIVIWGANPEVSGLHLVPRIEAARKRGARLVVIDPRRTGLASRADQHLALRPGTDLPLALAVIRWLLSTARADEPFLEAHTTGLDALRQRAEPWTFERAAETCGIEADAIAAFAELYAATSPAVIRLGWGVERNRNGGSAAAAILALPAVAGKFGVRGGGVTASNSGAWDHDPLAAAGECWPSTRVVNLNQVGRALTAAEPPVRLLFVYNCNPLATLPAQQKVRAGLAREDLFTVVFEQVMTDTARWADVVLPATTFLEHTELNPSYGALAMSLAPAVIAPVGQARSNHRVFTELCRRLGLARPDDPDTEQQAAAAVVRSVGDPAALAAELQSNGVAAPPCGNAPIAFVDVFPRTDDRRIHLFPPHLDAEAPAGLYGYREDPAPSTYPLTLITPAESRRTSSTFGQLSRTLARVEIHPDDAAARSIGDGQPVRVFNDQGEVLCPARVTAALRPGVVSLPKGLWSHHTLSGTTANTLCPDSLADLGGGACFNDARVEIEKTEATDPPGCGSVSTSTPLRKE